MTVRQTRGALTAAGAVPAILRHHNVRLDRVEYVAIDSLTTYDRKLRKRSDKGRRGLMNSVSSFGVVVPVLVDASGTIISGEGIVEAARAVGYTEVPVLRIEHLGEGEVRLLRIALNKLSENAEWDRAELAAEFTELIEMDLDLQYEVTGFDTIEIDGLLHAPIVDDGQDDPDDLVPDQCAPGSEVTRVGDLWAAGVHRVLCGSSLERDNLVRVMAGELARMVMTDHPFNVRIVGHVSGNGKHRHREFAQASGEMSEAEFVAFLTTSITEMSAICVDGALLYMYMDWRHVSELTTAIKLAALKLVNMAVWVKSQGGMGSLYRSQHELCFIAKKGSQPHRNNVQLGRFGRNRTNCWFYPGVNSFGGDRNNLLAMHPTSKSVSMIADAIRDVTDRGELVFDGFLGSGTTLIAAERTGRRCNGIELDPAYVDTIVQRWEKATGREALLDETGETFAQVRERRLKEHALAEEASIAPRNGRPEIVPRARSRIA